MSSYSHITQILLSAKWFAGFKLRAFIIILPILLISFSVPIAGDTQDNNVHVESIVITGASSSQNTAKLSVNSAPPITWPYVEDQGIYVVYYSGDYPDELRRLSGNIRWAMSYIEKASGVMFKHKERSTKDYIVFVYGSSCSSPVGWHPGLIEITLHESCTSRRGVLHELMHVLGFHHEHFRPDRDNYITMIDTTVTKLPASAIFNYTLLPYDLLSIMHYPIVRNYDSTISNFEPKDKSYEALLSMTRTQFSHCDLYRLNLVYPLNRVTNKGPSCIPNCIPLDMSPTRGCAMFSLSQKVCSALCKYNDEGFFDAEACTIEEHTAGTDKECTDFSLHKNRVDVTKFYQEFSRNALEQDREDGNCIFYHNSLSSDEQKMCLKYARKCEIFIYDDTPKKIRKKVAKNSAVSYSIIPILIVIIVSHSLPFFS